MWGPLPPLALLARLPALLRLPEELAALGKGTGAVCIVSMSAGGGGAAAAAACSAASPSAKTGGASCVVLRACSLQHAPNPGHQPSKLLAMPSAGCTTGISS